MNHDDDPTPICTRRKMRPRNDSPRPSRHFVAFRKHSPTPAWVEVTVMATTKKQAAAQAREIVRPLRGLIYEGVD